jgi:hypothetical protein
MKKLLSVLYKFSKYNRSQTYSKVCPQPSSNLIKNTENKRINLKLSSKC